MNTLEIPKATNIFEWADLEKMLEQGYISVQKHPSKDLWIYNYTHKAAYESEWNEITRNCRGLILNAEREIIARGFPKFFNLDEHPRSDLLFSRPFDVYDKMDGSLGIMYADGSVSANGDYVWAIATRGSFASTQAIQGTEILRKYLASDAAVTPNPGETFLFEIIYPSNRIVVNYGDMTDLVMLAVIDNATGSDVDDGIALEYETWPWPVVKRYDGIDCKPRDIIAHLNATDDGDTEGYVLRFKGTTRFTRVKVKLEEYKRLHRILTGVSTKTVWKYMSEALPMDDLIERVPDEFNNWLKGVIGSIEEAYARILLTAESEFGDIYNSPGVVVTKEVKEPFLKTVTYVDRKVFAEFAKTKQYPALLFSMLDERPDQVRSQIFKMIRPEYSKAFKVDIDNG